MFLVNIHILVKFMIDKHICNCMNYWSNWYWNIDIRSFEFMVWDIGNWRNLCSLLVTSLSGINNTFPSLCHSIVIPENLTWLPGEWWYNHWMYSTWRICTQSYIPDLYSITLDRTTDIYKRIIVDAIVLQWGYTKARKFTNHLPPV